MLKKIKAESSALPPGIIQVYADFVFETVIFMTVI